MKTLIEIIDTTGEPDIITQILDNQPTGRSIRPTAIFQNLKTLLLCLFTSLFIQSMQ